MIDFIKTIYRDKSYIEDYMLSRENFEIMYSVLELHSGEILYPYKTKLDILDITITPELIEIRNSIHKLYNYRGGNEPHNYDDFSYSAIKETIDYLETKLPNLNQANLTQLEFGLNIALLEPPEKIIAENILMHKTNAFNRNQRFNGKGHLIRFDYTNFLIKIYDKGKQYRLKKNILRFEIKLIRKSEFNKFGIYTLLDLKSKHNLKALFAYLLLRFDEMIIVDDLSYTKMSDVELSKLRDFVCYRYWNQDIKKLSRQTKSRRRKEFKLLLQKHNLLNTKMLLRNALMEKFNLLIES